MELRELSDRIFSTVETVIKMQPPNKVMEPLVIALRNTGIAILPVAPLFAQGADGRSIVAEAIREIANQSGMDAYVICMESYFLDMVGKTSEEATKLQATGIIDHPERQECITMTAGDATGTLLRIWIMHRDEDGRVIDLREKPIPQEMRFEGRFHDLLKPQVLH